MTEPAINPNGLNPRPERVHVLNVPIDCVTMDETVEMLGEFLSGSEPRFILTADSNAIINAETDDRYKRLFKEADLITPDSQGVVWALQRYGATIQSRVSGVDIVERLFALSAQKGYRIFLLGAGPEVAAKAAENLVAKYPGAVVAGTRDGFFKPSEDQVIASQIAETSPDILLVAMGMPRQELFILETQDIIRAKVAVGIGGSLDVHSGTVKRAPKLIQKVKLEWLWRLILNPKKIDKVKNLPRFYRKVRKLTS